MENEEWPDGKDNLQIKYM